MQSLGINPGVFHGNEGHTSFILLERARELVRSGLRFEEAAEGIRATSSFTTLTPGAAGHEAFPFSMMVVASVPLAGAHVPSALRREYRSTPALSIHVK